MGDFPLTQRIQGYWDRHDTEIDLVAVSEGQGIIRFGSCKRSPQRLLSDINNFKGHVSRFLETMPKYKSWQKQYVGIAPTLDTQQREILHRHEIMGQDLGDLTLEE